MKNARSYFFKLLLAALVAQLIRGAWAIAEPLRLPLWITIAVLAVLWILPHPGYPIFWLWSKYKGITSQGMRFFHGLGLFLLAIAAYRIWDAGDWQAALSIAEPLKTDTATLWAGGGLVAVLLGCIRPGADALFALWMKLAHAISAVMSRILLTIIYLISVLPVALVAAIVRKRFLVRGPDPNQTSYWIERSADAPAPESYLRQF
ncbi:MAG: hypothetical protein H7A21_13180 [Spirochaetales bacterium]|nr:hypothetical protein [Leptospiraceae bacterium]MCP5482381.1 hypothetical protein [Spirochaetales bacterium]MCP5484180.1 hypothetical protein [Spirochaetales bacterium]